MIQGSKLSGFLYTVFSVEIPLLPKILRDRQLAMTLLEMRIPEFYGIKHETNQFVDDSTSVIGCDSMTEMTNYMTQFHTLLEKFYFANKLKLNSDKTKTMVTKTDVRNARLIIKTTSNETIEDDKTMRILGYLKNSRDSYDSHLGLVSALVSKRLTELSPFLKHMTLKNRKEILYSKVASLLNYGIELYLRQTAWTIQKLTTIMMKISS